MTFFVNPRLGGRLGGRLDRTGDRLRIVAPVLLAALSLLLAACNNGDGGSSY
jgi:hypothetical protein